MDEKKRSRREWVKTAAIIFLSVMLVLTFFSNTIMNYSLPEVATQYVQSGSITAKIRGNGTIESSDPYNVMVKQTRTVQSVLVKSGDKVEKGDVLLVFEDEDSKELEAAKDALEAAQEAYDSALLSADVTGEAVDKSHSGISTTTYRQQITDAQNSVNSAKNEVSELQAKYDDLTSKIAISSSKTADAGKEKEALDKAETAMKNAEFEHTAASNAYSRAQSLAEYANSISSSDYEELVNQQNDANKRLIDAKAALDDATLEYNKAKAAYDKKIADEDSSGEVDSLKHEQNEVKADLDEKTRILTERQNYLTELTGNINKTLNLESLYKKIADAREEYDKILSQSVGSAVTASISGTITTVNASSGKEVSTVDPVFVIQPEGKGYTLSFSVTNDQAKRLAVGNVADIVNSWRYNDVRVVLSSIKPDTTDPGQRKLLTFDVDGDVTPGQSLSISVGQQSANYDLIVPNSAIREDNNGKFILTVVSKPGPINNRYIATRVDVEVIASDDTQSAISALLNGYEFVITTSTKPVEAGKQVRLADN